MTTNLRSRTRQRATSSEAKVPRSDEKHGMVKRICTGARRALPVWRFGFWLVTCATITRPAAAEDSNNTKPPASPAANGTVPEAASPTNDAPEEDKDAPDCALPFDFRVGYTRLIIPNDDHEYWRDGIALRATLPLAAFSCDADGRCKPQMGRGWTGTLGLTLDYQLFPFRSAEFEAGLKDKDQHQPYARRESRALGALALAAQGWWKPKRSVFAFGADVYAGVAYVNRAAIRYACEDDKKQDGDPCTFDRPGGAGAAMQAGVALGFPDGWFFLHVGATAMAVRGGWALSLPITMGGILP